MNTIETQWEVGVSIPLPEYIKFTRACFYRLLQEYINLISLAEYYAGIPLLVEPDENEAFVPGRKFIARAASIYPVIEDTHETLQDLVSRQTEYNWGGV